MENFFAFFMMIMSCKSELIGNSCEKPSSMHKLQACVEISNVFEACYIVSDCKESCKGLCHVTENAIRIFPCPSKFICEWKLFHQDQEVIEVTTQNTPNSNESSSIKESNQSNENLMADEANLEKHKEMISSCSKIDALHISLISCIILFMSVSFAYFIFKRAKSQQTIETDQLELGNDAL